MAVAVNSSKPAEKPVKKKTANSGKTEKSKK